MTARAIDLLSPEEIAAANAFLREVQDREAARIATYLREKASEIGPRLEPGAAGMRTLAAMIGDLHAHRRGT